VLVDKLGIPVAAQQDTEIIEPGDVTLQLDPVDQKNRHRRFAFADCVEKSVLQVLLFFGHDEQLSFSGLSPSLKHLSIVAFFRFAKT
jgi:hypothetical protein